jgi:hypothetical protein
VVAAVAAEYLLRSGTDAFRVVYDMEIRLDFSEKSQRFAVASPVTKQRQCFTDDIPSDIKTGACCNGICREILGLFMVDIPLFEAGVEERCVTEEAGWKRHLTVLCAGTIEVFFNVRGYVGFSSAALWEPKHQFNELFGGGSRLGLRQRRSQFRHDFVRGVFLSDA